MGAPGVSKITTRREHFAGRSAVVPTLCEGLAIQLSDFEEENATLQGYYLWQVVEIVIGGVPTVLEVHFMCLFMAFNRTLLQGSISTNLFNPMRHLVDLQEVEVGIQHFGNIYLVTGIIPPGVQSALHLGRPPSLSIFFLVHHLLLHELRSHRIGFGLGLVVSWPE
jgi:hypothetical protein